MRPRSTRGEKEKEDIESWVGERKWRGVGVLDPFMQPTYSAEGASSQSLIGRWRVRTAEYYYSLTTEAATCYRTRHVCYTVLVRIIDC